MSATINPPQKYYPQIDKGVDPKVSRHLQLIYSALNDHDSAIIGVNTKVANLKTTMAATTTTEVVSTSSSSNNATNFTGLGTVNDQEAVISYALQQSDNGALVVFDDASAIALSLNSVITSPFFCFVTNLGSGTVTMTPTSGTVNGGATFALTESNLSVVVFSGGNWWASAFPVAPVNTPAVAHEWLASYNAATGDFTQTQPAFTDISGVAATDQIGAGTPSAGEYVDGGTGAWTALPSGGVNFVDDETVSGSGTAWTLAFTPAAGCVPILVVQIPSFGGVTLLLGQTPGFTISGANITTTSSYAAGALAAWYRR